MAKALVKPALKGATKPATKIAVKPAAKAPAKAAAPKAPKEVKPYDPGSIVIFKGYAAPAAKGEKRIFKKDDELAIVNQREETVTDKDGKERKVTMVGVVPANLYNKFLADENSVEGEEVTADEIKRTSRSVEKPYEFKAIGSMDEQVDPNMDPVDAAKLLYNRAEESFFYLGGQLLKLLKVKDEEGNPVYTGYESPSTGKAYTADAEGRALFILETFGDNFGGTRKAEYYMSIYESVARLDNADEIIKELPSVGWWKAGMVTSYITNENAAELIEDAKNLSANELKDTIKTKYTQDGKTSTGKAASRASVKMTTFEFKLFEDQATGINHIWNVAKKQYNITNDAQMFEQIVTEWAADHLGPAEASKARAKTEEATKRLVKSNVKLPPNHPAAQQKTDASKTKAAA